MKMVLMFGKTKNKKQKTKKQLIALFILMVQTVFGRKQIAEELTITFLMSLI